MDISDPDIQSYIANEDIKRQLKVELASWMEGFYEHLVRILKSIIVLNHKSIKRTRL